MWVSSAVQLVVSHIFLGKESKISSDYLSFENNNYPVIESLYLYLTGNKKMVMKNIEVELNKLIDNDEIYKNDLYISTLLDINYHNINI